MSEITVVEVAAIIVLAAFIVIAWRVSLWLARRGHVVRPATNMDYLMSRNEERSAKDRALQPLDSERHHDPAEGR